MMDRETLDRLVKPVVEKAASNIVAGFLKVQPQQVLLHVTAPADLVAAKARMLELIGEALIEAAEKVRAGGAGRFG